MDFYVLNYQLFNYPDTIMNDTHISDSLEDPTSDDHTDDLDGHDDLTSLLGDAATMNIGKNWGSLTPVVVLVKQQLAPLNEVRRLTDLEIEALESAKSGARLAAKGDRQSWVFKDMQIYDTVRIAAEVASKAQAAMHTYSQRTKRRFISKRNADKSLQVTRIS